jgi:hypothetical protein
VVLFGMWRALIGCLIVRSAAPADSSGRGSWLSIRAIIHQPARLIILQEFSHKSGAKGGNDTP